MRILYNQETTGLCYVTKPTHESEAWVDLAVIGLETSHMIAGYFSVEKQQSVYHETDHPVQNSKMGYFVNPCMQLTTLVHIPLIICLNVCFLLLNVNLIL